MLEAWRMAMRLLPRGCLLGFVADPRSAGGRETNRAVGMRSRSGVVVELERKLSFWPPPTTAGNSTPNSQRSPNHRPSRPFASSRRLNGMLWWSMESCERGALFRVRLDLDDAVLVLAHQRSDCGRVTCRHREKLRPVLDGQQTR
jgi:hypothetical protein